MCWLLTVPDDLGMFTASVLGNSEGRGEESFKQVLTSAFCMAGVTMSNSHSRGEELGYLRD